MPKKGKVGGAFCETIHSIKESRILTNFGGTFNDVVTIAHELGHAFHNTRLFHLSQINSFYPMPIAETASNFCETIVVNEALKADENSALIIRKMTYRVLHNVLLIFIVDFCLKIVCLKLVKMFHFLRKNVANL